MRSAWGVVRRFGILALIGIATACATSDGQSAHPVDCSTAAMPTLYKKVFTFGTDQPAYPPWFLGDDPANGQGFESAVAYAVAGRLGYGADAVRWVRVPFNMAMAPGAKPFDADISQFSITDQRRELVDFSAPYYDVEQAVVTTAQSAAATVRSVAGLAALRLGAQVGTTSAAAARSVATEAPISVYNTNIDAKIALRSGDIDALVMDLPTAISVRDELDDGVIIGRLPTDSHKAEQLAIMLDKDSALTTCVSAAVDGLRADGTLSALAQRWLGAPDFPVLT